MAYSIDFIKQAVAYKQKGHSLKEVKEAFDIPHQTVYQWEKKLRNGHYDKIPARRERRRKIDKEKLKEAVAEKPDAYLSELAARFGCSPQAVFLMLRKLNITIKKRPLPTVRNRKSGATRSARD
jgi:transposase